MKTSEGMQIVGTGTATALRLLVATAFVTGAYVGASKAIGAHAESDAPARTITLSARSVPVETDETPALGTVSVSRLPGDVGCDQTYRAQSFVADDSSYDWRLQRWNSSSGVWQTYLAGNGGFAGKSRVVRWSPRVVDNPGWYRVRLEITGKTFTSDKFQVSC